MFSKFTKEVIISKQSAIFPHFENQTYIAFEGERYSIPAVVPV